MTEELPCDDCGEPRSKWGLSACPKSESGNHGAWIDATPEHLDELYLAAWLDHDHEVTP